MLRNRSLSSGMASSLPIVRTIKVDTRGAVILEEESPEVSAVAEGSFSLKMLTFGVQDSGQSGYIPSKLH